MSDAVTKEEIIEELKRVANLLGKNQVSRSEFTRHSKITSSCVERTFGTWNKAVEAAGLVPATMFFKLSDDKLAQEFSRVRQQLGKIPTRTEFVIHGRHSPTVYERRFGSWGRAVEHYMGNALGYEKAMPVKPRLSKRAAPLAESHGRRLFGSPLNFRELRHEPINEQGVVFLFGMVAKELGFLVEAIATEYPDCVAKRQIRGRIGGYVPVNIEFEFRSSNFHHDPSGCDLIVCWENDWPDCPIEVIELKTAIKDLPQSVSSL
jgi:hypothetical protein